MRNNQRFTATRDLVGIGSTIRLSRMKIEAVVEIWGKGKRRTKGWRAAATSGPREFKNSDITWMIGKPVRINGIGNAIITTISNTADGLEIDLSSDGRFVIPKKK